MLANTSAPTAPVVHLPAPRARVDRAALERAQQALSALSLEQKVQLLAGNGTMTLAAQPSIGVLEEFWFSDGPHTVRPELDRMTFNSAQRTDDHSTLLPTLSALAATWDVELAERFGRLLGAEARHRGKDVLLGPGVNLMRTPLNGRNYEYLGEDPHLAACVATAYVRGLQSQDVAACVKHFVANDQELARGSVDVHMDERTLRELYLAPFEAAVIEGGVLTVMNGYNRFRGEYCSHNTYLNNTVLKHQWAFPGFVVSDWGGLHDTVAGALGGLDVEMHAGEAIRHYREPLVRAVRDGRVPASVVDGMALRVLYVMARIGKLGTRPRAKGARNTRQHQEFARTVAERSIVLLKNDRSLLPLSREAVRSVLVIGANADARHAPGGWSAEGKPPYEKTPLEGLREVLGDAVRLEHIPGPFAEVISPLPESVIETIDASDLSRGAAQKGWLWEVRSGASERGPVLSSGLDRELDVDCGPRLASLPLSATLCWTVEITVPETGLYCLALHHDGWVRLRLNGLQLLEARAEGIAREDHAAVELVAGTRATLLVEFSRVLTPGRCRFGWRTPSRAPITPVELCRRATSADAVIFLVGNRLGHGRAQECEGADRPSLALPEGEDEAVSSVLAARPDTVVVCQSGAPVAMPWCGEAPTLVHYWFSGMEGGSALARVLFGLVNPSGKLPFTIPRRLADTPAHANDNYGPVRVAYEEGVFIGYRWHDQRGIEPLFPFGHGLSYTTFELGEPEPEFTEIPAGDRLEVRVSVSNTGDRTGAVTVQLYVGPVAPRVPRPPRELRAFAKVTLRPGETRSVVLELPPRAFAYWDTPAAAWRVDPGLYCLYAGSSSLELTPPARVLLR